MDNESPVAPAIGTGIVVVLTVGFVSIVGGMVILIITDHDPTGYVLSIGTLLTSIGGFWQLLRVQKRQSREIDLVKRQTNGNWHRMEQSKASTEVKLMAALSALPPHKAQEILENTLTRSELDQLRDQAARMEGHA